MGKILKQLSLIAFFFLIEVFGFNPGIHAAEPINPWVADIDLPYKLAGHSSLSFNNSLFIITGSAQTFNSHNEVKYSQSGSNGVLSTWQNWANYPKPMIWNTAVTKGNFIYGLGGFEEYSQGSKFSDEFVYFS
ncbi:MAG: hypothetical protein Q8L51_01885, partial [Candidatus Amesbacteria bacterium]|nr:hypothetical protein [Candidatus Amesbacteria bacterium]